MEEWNDGMVRRVKGCELRAKGKRNNERMEYWKNGGSEERKGES